MFSVSHLAFEDDIHSLVSIRLHLANASRQTRQVHCCATHVSATIYSRHGLTKLLLNIAKLICLVSAIHSWWIASFEVHKTRRKVRHLQLNGRIEFRNFIVKSLNAYQTI